MDKSPQRVAVLLHNLSYVRFFDSVVAGLLAEGHMVHLQLQRNLQPSRDELAWLTRMEENPNFEWSLAGRLASWERTVLARWLRRSTDYMRFLEPPFSRATYFVARAERRAPASVRATLRRPRLREAVRRLPVLQFLEWLDASLPHDPQLVRDIRALRADLIVLSPHLMPGARHSDCIRVAHMLGTPTALCVASWDNLTSKQLIRDEPTQLIVWNETQRTEAVELHGISPGRIVVTGAQSFDRWFGWQNRTREEFCARVGLRADTPFLTYVGGALAPGSPTEAEWFSTWLSKLRSSHFPLLSQVQVLVRPHPKRFDEWSNAGLTANPPKGVRVWPATRSSMPVGELARADYFDSLYHSAGVVGLNTSAMIEAAIARRPVFTILVPEFVSSQRGTLHFDYLSTVGGGMLQVAETWDEHHEALMTALNGEAARTLPAIESFLLSFVRPRGLEQPVGPILVSTLLATTELGVPAVRRANVVGRCTVWLLTTALRIWRLRLLPYRVYLYWSLRVGRRNSADAEPR